MIIISDGDNFENIFVVYNALKEYKYNLDKKILQYKSFLREKNAYSNSQISFFECSLKLLENKTNCANKLIIELEKKING